MLNVLATTLNRGEESAAQEFLEMFIEIAESQPRFLRRNLQEISDAMLQVMISLHQGWVYKNFTFYLGIVCSTPQDDWP
jgi:hypothetical protein